MSIPIDSQCLLCHFQRNLELAQSLGDSEQVMEFARELMRMYLNAPADVGSPWFGPQTAQMFYDHFGLPIDRYREEKLQSNQFVMERFSMLQDRVASAPDPVYAGLQCSILGNYLDFSALRGQVSFEKLEEMLQDALKMELDRQVYASLCEDLKKGRKLLYLTDNAGEIGFDRIFAEEIAKAYPQLQITFCVRGGIAQNDATREDAEAVGIPFPVIDNGNCVAGTQMDLLSEEAKQAFTEADVILAKGMGNTETMYGCGYNVYYAFLVKCEKFIRLFDKPMFTPMLVKELK